MNEEFEINNRRNLYGRRSSRLTLRKKDLFEERRIRYLALADRAQALDPSVLFSQSQDTWLEIGFGAGEHLAAQATANPQIGLIGCEHYVDGVASCFSRLEREEIHNVRVHHGDARDLMDALPDASIGRSFLLYPDPWPKARHHKRRFINPENLDSFARIMVDGAHLRVASDIPEYIDWTREALAEHSDFSLVADTGDAWPDWPGTRYEAKALREGRIPAYLTYERSAR